MEPVSAAIGLGVVGVQVGATTYKLQKLWGEIKEVPDNIRDLLEKLKIVSSQLSNAELLPSSEETEQRCLNRCQKTHRELTKLASELEDRLHAGGKLRQKAVALKAIMDKDILDKYEKRLEAALSMFKLDLQLSVTHNTQETTELLRAQAIQNSTQFSAQNAHAKAVTATLSVITGSQARAGDTSERILETLEIQNSDRIENSEAQRAHYAFMENAMSHILAAQATNDTHAYQLIQRHGESFRWASLAAAKSPKLVLGQQASGDSLHADNNFRYKFSSQSRLAMASRKQSTSFSVLGQLFGNIARESDKDTQKQTLRLEPPRWLSSAVFEITSLPHLSTHVFRIYNVISQDSDILRSIQDGDKSMAMQLFQTRKASPYDVDENNNSLLEYAARFQQPEMCEFLLQSGLSDALAKPVGPSRFTPLQTSIWQFQGLAGTRSNQKREDVVKVFQNHLRRIDQLPLDMVYNYLFELENGDQLMVRFQENFMLDFYQRPISERAESVRHGIFTDLHNCSFLRTLISSNGQMSHTDLASSTTAKVSLLHSAAVCLGKRFGPRVVPFRKPVGFAGFYTQDWGSWVEDLAGLSTSEDLHTLETLTPPHPYGQVTEWRGTPLHSLIGGLFCWLFPYWRLGYWDRAIRGTMREWLRLLRAGGVDLVEYGQHEYELLHAEPSLYKAAFDADSSRASTTIVRPILTEGTLEEPFTVPEYGGCRETDVWRPLRILELVYGPEPEDWRLIWVVEYEYMAYEFWQVVETPMVSMPGSWVE